MVRAKPALTLSRRISARGRRVVATGRLRVPARAGACPSGARVTVELRGRGRTLARRRPRLSASCRYTASFFTGGATPRALQLRAAFPGSETLLAARRTVPLRLPGRV